MKLFFIGYGVSAHRYREDTQYLYHRSTCWSMTALKKYHEKQGECSLDLVRHESAPPLAAESAAGKARPSVFRTKPWA